MGREIELAKNKISVIMPAYNTEKYIGKSIESVLKQDYEDFELIVVDDGSKDNTKNIVRQYAAKDARIKLIVQEENQGVSVARNTGIDIAQGDYIAFLDSDDLWEKDSLSVLLTEALHSKAGFICAKMDTINFDGTKKQDDIPVRSGNLFDFITKNNEIRPFWHIGSVLIRRDILEGDIYFDKGATKAEDLGFYIKLFCKTEVKGIDKTVAHYCKRENSETTSLYNPEKWCGRVEIFKYAEPYVLQCGKYNLDKYYAIWDYYAYRFVWEVVKHKLYDDAVKYISRYEKNLRRFTSNGNKANDRLKCRCLLQKNVAIMKLLNLIGRNKNRGG